MQGCRFLAALRKVCRFGDQGKGTKHVSSTDVQCRCGLVPDGKSDQPDDDCGVLSFDLPTDYERLKATVEHRLLRFETFQAASRRAPGTCLFTSTIGKRIRISSWSPICTALPYRRLGDSAVPRVVVNDLASTPLDLLRPLWQFHLVENYGEGCVLFCRLHHAIADGIALMHVLLSLCDDTADSPWPALLPSQKRPPRGLVSTMLRPARLATIHDA